MMGAGTAGYCVGNLKLDALPLPHEDPDFKYPDNLASPLQILIDASNGASDYGNKFGEPLVAGYTRTFGQRLANGERREWLKPIMFSGGLGQVRRGCMCLLLLCTCIAFGAKVLGLLLDTAYCAHFAATLLRRLIHSTNLCHRQSIPLTLPLSTPLQIDHSHLHKADPEVSMLVVKIGGPAYRIGMGGGAASSVPSGSNKADLDFNAVQRGDAEMAQKLWRVVRSCVELGEPLGCCWWCDLRAHAFYLV
jgi:phosphoribosylformylglycinamidine (FGAM) synthase-like enzyme